MEKTKKMPKNKENSKKEDGLTKEMAIESLKKEINEHQILLLKKQGALEVLMQID